MTDKLEERQYFNSKKRYPYDWETIRASYRTGQYSVKQLKEMYGPTENAIRKRISREGWTKDLSQAVDRETKGELVKRKIEREQDYTTLADEDIVRETALRNVEKIEQQQTRLQNHSKLVHQYSNLLHKIFSGRVKESDFKLIITNEDGEVVEERELPVLNKNHGIGGVIKDLLDQERILIDMERKVHNLDQAQAEDELPTLKIKKVTDE